MSVGYTIQQIQKQTDQLRGSWKTPDEKDGAVDQCGDGRNEKRSDCGQIVKGEPTGFAAESDVTNGRTRRVKHDSKWSGLSSRKEDIAL